MKEFIINKAFKFCLLFVTFVIFLTIFVMAPSAQEFITDRDHGFQLLGAQEILFGRHPFIDFKTPYGPMVFYMSAAAQALSNSRLIGEIILDSVGFFIAYILLFIIAFSVSKRLTIATAVTLLALLFFPLFYKYYILLGPALILASMWSYTLKQSNLRLFFLAFSLALTLLFRLDFGLYGLIGSFSLILFISKNRVKPILLLISFICVFYSPWFLALGITGHLFDYLYQSTIGSIFFGIGTSLPLPTLTSHAPFAYNNAVIILLLFFFIMPFATLFMLFIKRGAIERNEKAFILAISVYAAFSFIQTIHRLDVSHLFQSMAPQYILLAWHGKMTLSYGTKMRFTLVVAAVILIISTFIVLQNFEKSIAYRLGKVTTTIPEAVAYFKNKKEYIEYLLPKNAQSPELQTIDYIRSNKSITSMVSLPFSPQLTYWTGLPLASSFLFVAPGYFVNTSDQTSMINELELKHPMAIVYQLDQVIQTRNTKTMAEYLPLVHTYIFDNYTPSESVGPYTVYIHK